MIRSHRFQYEDIAHVLGQRIAEGVYDQAGRLPSETTLATEFTVNRLTLRKALALLDEAGLVRREKGRGTFINPTMVRTHQQHLQTGYLYIGDYEGHFWREFYLAVCIEAQHRQLPVSAFNPAREAAGSDVKQRIRSLLKHDYRVICSGWAWAEVEKLVTVGHIPPVRVHLMEERFPDRGYAVLADRIRAGMLAAEHLIAQGHRRLAFLGAPPSDLQQRFPGVAMEADAVAGFRLALLRAGIDDFRCLGYFGDGPTQEALVRDFMAADDGWATGYVCDTDFRAAHVYGAARELGLRVPADISVVGMGNTAWCQLLRPQLTSVSFHERELARLAVALCDAPPPDSPVTQHVEPRLTDRASVAPPRA